MLYIRPVLVLQFLIFEPFAGKGGVKGSEISSLTD